MTLFTSYRASTNYLEIRLLLSQDRYEEDRLKKYNHLLSVLHLDMALDHPEEWKLGATSSTISREGGLPARSLYFK